MVYPQNYYFADGTSVKLEAVPASGYEFLEWSGALSGSQNPTTIMMTCYREVTAHFTEIAQTTHTLTVDISPSVGGHVRVDGDAPSSYPAIYDFDHGTSVSLEAVPADEGWYFATWEGGVAAGHEMDNPLSIQMDADRTVTARFLETSNELHVGPGQPYTIIQDAVDAAPPGATIMVHDGIYSENVKVDKSLDIRSENGSTETIVQAASPDDHVFEVTANGVTISGFAVENASGNSKAGIYLNSADDCIISNNSASNNWYGIYLYESSSSTVSDNTANDNSDRGIYIHYSSGNNISGNTANNNNSMGVYIHYSSGNTLNDNIATGTKVGAGIHLVTSDNNIIGNSTIDNNTSSGIYLFMSDSNTFVSNAIQDNGHGVHVVDSSGNWFVGNDIRDNDTEEGSGVHLNVIWTNVADNHLLFNNIVDNSLGTSYGVYNETIDIVGAILNWWGDASGPYYANANPSGAGDRVSDGVAFEPWLGASVAAVEGRTTETGIDTIDATEKAHTEVIKAGAGTPTIWVAGYSDNPAGAFSAFSIGKWIDVHLDSAEDVEQIEIKLDYTPEEINGLAESSLRLYWWSGSNWMECSDSGVNEVEDYIWARITADSTPGLDDVTGTPFAGGGQPYYALTANVSPGGNGTVTLEPSPPAEGYVGGTEVILTAVASEGYEFDHWSGALSGSENPTAITMDSAKEVTAYFSRITYTLTVDVSPTGGGTVSLEPSQPAEGYVEGTEVTLTAVASEGYEFDHWSGALSGSENPTTITMDSEKAVTADFTEVPSSPFPWWWIVFGVGVVVVGLLVYFLVIRRWRA